MYLKYASFSLISLVFLAISTSVQGQDGNKNKSNETFSKANISKIQGTHFTARVSLDPNSKSITVQIPNQKLSTKTITTILITIITTSPRTLNLKMGRTKQRKPRQNKSKCWSRWKLQLSGLRLKSPSRKPPKSELRLLFKFMMIKGTLKIHTWRT